MKIQPEKLKEIDALGVREQAAALGIEYKYWTKMRPGLIAMGLLTEKRFVSGQSRVIRVGPASRSLATLTARLHTWALREVGARSGDQLSESVENGAIVLRLIAQGDESNDSPMTSNETGEQKNDS